MYPFAKIPRVCPLHFFFKPVPRNGSFPLDCSRPGWSTPFEEGEVLRFASKQRSPSFPKAVTKQSRKREKKKKSRGGGYQPPLRGNRNRSERHVLFLLPSHRVNMSCSEETGNGTASGRNVNVEPNNNRALGPPRLG